MNCWGPGKLGVKLNWLAELGGIGVIYLGLWLGARARAWGVAGEGRREEKAATRAGLAEEARVRREERLGG